MPWPTPIMVTETFLFTDGTHPGTDSAVDFLLTQPLTDTVTGNRVAARLIIAPLTSGGQMAVQLAANDDPTTVPAGTAYLVTERIAGQDPRQYYILVPRAAPGGTIPLGLLVPGSVAPPVNYGLGAVTVPAPLAVVLAGGTAAISWDPSGDPTDVLTRTPTGAAWSPVGVVGGDKTYTHTQGAPSAVWVVVHNLGKYPAIAVQDSAGTRVQGSIHDDSLLQATLTFSAPFSGIAVCN